MKCPVCKEEGKRSIVTEGPTMTTDMYSAPFYDEDGKRHFHDPNRHDTQYTCSEGHRFWSSWRDVCWCENPEPPVLTIHEEKTQCPK